jgi:hypothetical protein
MTAWMCTQCATQYPDTSRPPDACPICADEREAVNPDGQQWTSAAELKRDHRSELREEEPGLLGIGIEPSFAIGQRALLVQTPAGNVLWDCVPFIDEAAYGQITALGGVSTICISHPHFYSGMIDLAAAFDARILLAEADARWIQRPSPRIEFFTDSATPVPDVTVARIGGHFDGASVLHWPAGSGAAGALLTGDTINVVADREWVSFMYSFPNLIPLDEATIRTIVERTQPFAFDRVYGGWWGSVVVQDGPAAIRRSAERYIAHLNGTASSAGRSG